MIAEVVNQESQIAVVKSEGPIELVADKGYHSREVVRDLSEAAFSSTLGFVLTPLFAGTT